jgi:hypothetical protein
MDNVSELSAAERRDLRRIAGIMIPADAELGVVGADDPSVFAAITGSMGRDTADVRAALGELAILAGGVFADLPPDRAEAVAAVLLARSDRAVATLGRVVLQCYYRDDRVMISLGLEPRPPFPKGHAIEQGDWSLLDPVRRMQPFWRDVPPA